MITGAYGFGMSSSPDIEGAEDPENAGDLLSVLGVLDVVLVVGSFVDEVEGSFEVVGAGAFVVVVGAGSFVAVAAAGSFDAVGVGSFVATGAGALAVVASVVGAFAVVVLVDVVVGAGAGAGAGAFAEIGATAAAGSS